MKFSFSKERLFLNFLLGILWSVFGFSCFFEEENLKWIHFAFIAMGLLYLVLFIYEFLSKYFEISHDKLKLLTLPKTEIEIKDLIEVKYYAGVYTLRTQNKVIQIAKSQINKKELPEFEKFFNDLEIK